MSFAILRFDKRKGGDSRGIQAHHEREKESYASNPDIDPSRSPQNVHIVAPVASYSQEAENRIQAAGCRTRKDNVRFVDTLITASPEFFTDKTPEQVQSFFTDAVEFMSCEVGEHNIFSAVVHLDERTPHLHLCFTPITKDNRLSAKDIFGNKKQMVQWQDKFFDYMVQRHPELERGKSAELTGRKHVPAQLFKQAERLDKQVQEVQKLVGGLSITNLSKRKGDIQHSLKALLPAAGGFSADVQAVENNLQRLRQRNAEMSAELLRTNEEIELLKRDNSFAKQAIKEKQKLLDKIPAQIRAQYLGTSQKLQRQK